MIEKFLLLTSMTLVTLVPFSVHSLSSLDDALLAKQCQTLSQQLDQLSAIQTDDSCTSKIDDAGICAEWAGESIVNGARFAAKSYLKLSINALKHVEGIGCEKSSEITIAKSELIEIESQIAD